jgi:hypothetical protein
MLPPHRHGLTLIHFSAQPEPFLSLNPSKVANKKCLRLSEKWTSVSPCTPAKCTSGGVAQVKEKKTIAGSGRIACPDPPEYRLSTNQGHDTMIDCQLTSQGAYLVHIYGQNWREMCKWSSQSHCSNPLYRSIRRGPSTTPDWCRLESNILQHICPPSFLESNATRLMI